MDKLNAAPGPIGIFDSGYGGLTILHGIRKLLPCYDYLYLGDNARAPYGPRSFDVVYEFTRQAVVRLLSSGATSSYWDATRHRPRRCAQYSRTTCLA